MPPLKEAGAQVVQVQTRLRVWVPRPQEGVELLVQVQTHTPVPQMTWGVDGFGLWRTCWVLVQVSPVSPVGEF